MRATLLSHGFRSCCFQPTANDAPPTYFFTPKTNAARLAFRASLCRNMPKRRDFVGLPPDFPPRSSGNDACANPLRPLPSPDLLAEPSRPRMLQECGLQVRKYWGSKAIQKNDETSRLFKTTTSKRTSFTEPLRTSENFEFLNCLSRTEIYALPRKKFF